MASQRGVMLVMAALSVVALSMVSSQLIPWKTEASSRSRIFCPEARVPVASEKIRSFR